MGVEPNWGLLGNAPNIGQSFQQGMAMGRQNAIQAKSDNALAAVQKDPTDTNALGTLAIYNPQAANAVIQMRGVQRQEAQRNALNSAYDATTGRANYRVAAQRLAAQGDVAGAQALITQGQTAATGQQEFQRKVIQHFVTNLDASDLQDDAHYHAMLQRTAPMWKDANLPVPTWLPQSVNGLTAKQKSDLFDSLQTHALDAAGQIEQRAPDVIAAHPGDVFYDKSDMTTPIGASPLPHITPGPNGSFYQQDPYVIPKEPAAGDGEGAQDAPTPTGHIIGATLPSVYRIDPKPAGGATPSGSGTFPAPGSPAALSYKNPAYAPVEAHLEQKYGLPPGIMAAIRTKGERSNDNQVSSAGARSVYQVIPSTRAGVLKKYGVDAYADPYGAAEAAALVLREGLQRNHGDARAAIREYIGGTDPSQWGPVTNAYVARTAEGF